MAAFVDTNILIYAFANSSIGDVDKVPIAQTLLATLFKNNELVVSAQVLSEFSVNALRKGNPPHIFEQVLDRVREVSTQTVIPIDASLVRLALEHTQQSRIGYWTL